MWMLGLPTDVIVWSVLLHLVRHEVYRRSERVLRSGKLSFAINAGGAHVYTAHLKKMEEVLARRPKPHVLPLLHIVNREESIFDLAKNYVSAIEKKKPADPVKQEQHRRTTSQVKVMGYGTSDCYHPPISFVQVTEDKKST